MCVGDVEREGEERGAVRDTRGHWSAQGGDPYEPEVMVGAVGAAGPGDAEGSEKSEAEVDPPLV